MWYLCLKINAVWKPVTFIIVGHWSWCHLILWTVNGQWDDWKPLTDCSVSCGGGTRKMYRNCVYQDYGGDVCEGPSTREETCENYPCPSMPSQPYKFLLAQLSQRIKRAFLIKMCSLSVVVAPAAVVENFSYFLLLLRNYLANFLKTWHRVYLSKGD
jgi:hypothetical protein